MLKEQYYQLINKYNIRDFLSNLNDYSYSNKTKLIEMLVSKFDSETINMALNQYELNYYRLNRVNLNYIEKVIYGLCKIQVMINNKEK